MYALSIRMVGRNQPGRLGIKRKKTPNSSFFESIRCIKLRSCKNIAKYPRNSIIETNQKSTEKRIFNRNSHVLTTNDNSDSINLDHLSFQISNLNHPHAVSWLGLALPVSDGQHKRISEFSAVEFALRKLAGQDCERAEYRSQGITSAGNAAVANLLRMGELEAADALLTRLELILTNDLNTKSCCGWQRLDMATSNNRACLLYRQVPTQTAARAGAARPSAILL